MNSNSPEDLFTVAEELEFELIEGVQSLLCRQPQEATVVTTVCDGKMLQVVARGGAFESLHLYFRSSDFDKRKGYYITQGANLDDAGESQVLSVYEVYDGDSGAAEDEVLMPSYLTFEILSEITEAANEGVVVQLEVPEPSEPRRKHILDAATMFYLRASGALYRVTDSERAKRLGKSVVAGSEVVGKNLPHFVKWFVSRR